MKYPKYILILLFTAAFTTSCSSLVSKDDCKKDMQSLGMEHGQKGQIKLTEEVRKVCISNENSVNLELYEKGFAIGWNEYCSPIHGYQMGRKGDLYRSFCPFDKEELYREKFLIGKKVYEKKDQVTELEEKIKDLSSAELDLSGKDELKRYQEYLRSLNREIQSLEQKGQSLVHTN